MHIVMENLSPPTNGRIYGVLGFFFELDAAAPDIPFFTKILEEKTKNEARILAEEVSAAEDSNGTEAASASTESAEVTKPK